MCWTQICVDMTSTWSSVVKIVSWLIGSMAMVPYIDKARIAGGACTCARCGRTREFEVELQDRFCNGLSRSLLLSVMAFIFAPPPILTQFSHVRRPLRSAHLLLCLPLFSFTWPLLPLFVTLWELTPQDLSLISRTRVFPVNGKRELGPRGPSYLFFALDFYMFLRMREFLPSFVLLLSLLVI